MSYNVLSTNPGRLLGSPRGGAHVEAAPPLGLRHWVDLAKAHFSSSSSSNNNPYNPSNMFSITDHPNNPNHPKHKLLLLLDLHSLTWYQKDSYRGVVVTNQPNSPNRFELPCVVHRLTDQVKAVLQTFELLNNPTNPNHSPKQVFIYVFSFSAVYIYIQPGQLIQETS